MGVPGAKSFHLLAPGYGNPAGLQAVPPTANPYFVRFSSDLTSTTVKVIEDVVAQQPSFFTLWIGNNDVLGYATSGGIDDVNDPNFDPITPVATFDGAYGGVLATINTAENKGMLVNIPDVSTIPYFTTVPYNPVPLDQATADALNAAYVDYNNAVAAILGATDPDQVARRTITFTAGQNALVIMDETLDDLTTIDPALVSMRQATAEDLILLPASAYIGTENPNSVGTTPPLGKPWGVGMPLEDSDVLLPSEILEINTARLAFNATIKGLADADPNLIFFDAAAIMTELNANGIDYGTGYIDATYATGGAFSLDGVHPTARGYAVIANKMIDAINAGFGASILKVDPGTRTTIFFK